MKQPGCIKMFYKISIPIFFFLFASTIQAMHSSDFHYDAVDYQIYRTCLENGEPLPESEKFSFDALEESPLTALLFLNQFIVEQHKNFHDSLVEALNDIDDEEQEGLIQAMLSLGIGITYESGVLTTRHRSFDEQDIVYVTKKEQAAPVRE